MPTPQEIHGQRTLRNPTIDLSSVLNVFHTSAFTTAQVTVVAAAVPDQRAVLYSFQMTSSAVAEISLMAGATVIWMGSIPTNSVVNIVLNRPITFPVGSEISVRASAAATVTVNLQGDWV